MAKQRLIIDTDPGIDDVLAMLLAFASKFDELEILLISVTHGNVEVQDCLRNVISIFHILERELLWREKEGRSLGFEAIRRSRPKIAVGAEAPLEDQLVMADFYHGIDGLGGIHTNHPHLTPPDVWKSLFNTKLDIVQTTDKEVDKTTSNQQPSHLSYIPTSSPGHEEILNILADNPSDTVTIVAVGPLTNLALAAAKDPETFLKAREVVVMGGNIKEPGNITPLGEFNCHADPIAFARVLALTSPEPNSTLPPIPETSVLTPYPQTLSRRLNLTLLPLDITTRHSLAKATTIDICEPLRQKGSPLAEWCMIFLDSVWRKTENVVIQSISLHDPLCIWWCLTHTQGGESADRRWTTNEDEDIRIEVAGQWSRGACIVDGRGREKIEGGHAHDRGDWMHQGKGNRVRRAIESPARDDINFQNVLMSRIFGC